MRPGRRLLWMAGAWCALGALASALPQLLGPWAAAGGGVLALALIDAVVLWRTPTPELRRELPAALSLGEWQTLDVTLETALGRPLRVAIFDGCPVAFESRGLPQSVTVPVRGRARLQWALRPLQRGSFEIGRAELLVAGPLGLLRALRLAGEPTALRVYPNFRQVAKYALLALDNRTSQMGIHLKRRRGEGIEFFQLREYRDGDTLRQVDWKAVSRRHQLVSREYREEQNQQVVFLLDCGRRMHTRDGELTHLDRVLDAVLLLSYVALRNGDAVGLMTFSGPDRWLPPRKGRGAVNSVLNGVFDLQTSTAPSDYAEAARRLGARQRRRSLVVLLTNLRDDDSDDLPAALAPLRRRHLVLVASLREPVLREALEAPVAELGDALRAAAAWGYLEQRRRSHRLVAGRGAHMLDAEPAELPVALVNRYLAIKRSGLL